MCNCKVPANLRNGSPLFEYASGPYVVMDDGTLVCEQCSKTNGRIDVRTDQYFDDDARWFDK